MILDREATPDPEDRARQLGARVGVACSVVGLLIAQAFLTIISTMDGNWKIAFFWFVDVDYLFNIIVGVAGLLFTSWRVGAWGGRAILISGANCVLIGIITALTTLLVGTFFGSCVGFLQEGLVKQALGGALYDYLVKPVLLIGLVGFLPCLGLGVAFGVAVRSLK